MTEFDSLDDLGPSNVGLDYETQRYASASGGAKPTDFKFDLTKCANCDKPPVFTLDRPQFETVAFCGEHIPPQFQEQAVADSTDAEVDSKVKAEKPNKPVLKEEKDK